MPFIIMQRQLGKTQNLFEAYVLRFADQLII